jgi:hypothetical protein
MRVLDDPVALKKFLTTMQEGTKESFCPLCKEEIKDMWIKHVYIETSYAGHDQTHGECPHCWCNFTIG